MVKKFIASTVLILAVGACGDDAATTSINTIDEALGTVNTQLAAVGGLGYESTLVKNLKRASIAAPKRNFSPLAGTAFGDNWTDADLINRPDSSGEQTSIKDFMGDQLDPDAVGQGEGGSDFAINIFGRFNSSMMIACALMTLNTVDANGYPVNGESEITLNAANLAILVEKCEMTAGDALYLGAAETPPVIAVTTTDATDTTYYDKKVVMELDDQMGGATQTFMVRFNNTAVNILNIEDGDYDSRTIVNYDVATKVLRVEYYSGGENSFWYYRLFFDESNDQGRLVATIGGADNSTRYSLAGKPSSAGTFALSFSDTDADVIHSACVNSADGTIETDGSLECTVTGLDLDAAEFTWLETAHGARTDAGWITPSETLSANWTLDTTFTETAQY